MSYFLNIIFILLLVRIPAAYSEEPPAFLSLEKCKAAVSGLTSRRETIESLLRLADSLGAAQKFKDQAGIYRYILETYPLSVPDRIQTLVNQARALTATSEFGSAESLLSEARELALESSPQSLEMVYLQAGDLFSKWAVQSSQAEGKIKTAYFRLAEKALKLAAEWGTTPERLQKIKSSRDSLREAILRGIRSASGSVAVATRTSLRPALQTEKKDERLALNANAAELYNEGILWLWSYFESHSIAENLNPLDSRPLIDKAISALAKVKRTGMSKRQRIFYDQLKKVRGDLRASDPRSSNAEKRAISFIDSFLFAPWKSALLDFITVLRNNAGDYSESMQANVGDHLFQILAGTPDKIREGISGVGNPGSAPITAGLMYEHLLSFIEDWAPRSRALISLRQKWMELLHQRLHSVAEYRAERDLTSTASR